MLKQFIGVATAILSLSAHAFVAERSLWTIDINGLDQYISNSTSYWVYGQYHYYFNEFEFTMPDGEMIPEISISMTYKGNHHNIFETSSSTHFDAIPGLLTNGVPISYSTVSFDALGNHYEKSGLGMSIITGLTGTAQQPSVTYSIQSFLFNAGKGTNPSTDASCQTFSCMTNYTTEGKLRIRFIAALTVPEPKNLYLILAGLLTTGAALSHKHRTDKSKHRNKYQNYA